MQYRYTPEGVCSYEILLDIEGDTINDVIVKGGCPGNALGIRNLLQGMKIEDAIKKMKGVRCGGKSTSCPDQIAKALEQIASKN